MRRNRALYGFLLLGVGAAALLYADPLIYMALYGLLALPLLSWIAAFSALRGVRVSLPAAQAVVTKGEANRFALSLQNRNIFGLGQLRCLFTGHFALKTDIAEKSLELYPFMPPCAVTVNFTAKYRGTYRLGLRAAEIQDALGLFKIRRRFTAVLEVVVCPRITDAQDWQLAAHLFTKTQSNRAVLQDDYEEVVDVRPYAPADPLKKVHWKLTAKRGEWMVKNYQSAVKNTVTVLVDTAKGNAAYAEEVKREDRIIEQATAIAYYCLRRQTPVSLLFSQDGKAVSQKGDFETLYKTLTYMAFEAMPLAPLTLLEDCINEAESPLHMAILTSVRDDALEAKVAEAGRFGHHVVLLPVEGTER